MSGSETVGHSDTGTLVIQAPRDVEFCVLDGQFNEVKRGFGEHAIGLRQGIYVVQWAAAGISSQEFVRIQNGHRVIKDYIDDGIAKEARSCARAMDIGRNHVASDSAGLMLMIPWKAGPPSETFMQGFRVAMANSMPLSQRSQRPVTHFLSGDFLLLQFRLPAGSYVLCYNSIDRIAVQQTMHVYPARWTVAFMGIVRAGKPEGLGEKAHIRVREGVEPSHTRVISLTPDASLEDMERSIRLAGTLLHKLGLPDGECPDELWHVVRKHSDPYIRTYAVTLLLGEILGFPTHPEFDDGRATAIADRAAELLEHPGLYHSGVCSPDTECAWWRIATINNSERSEAFSDLRLPPMLARAWDWATERSLIHSGSGVLPPEIVAASLSRLPSKPWLSWRSYASKTSDDMKRLGTIKDEQAGGPHAITMALSEIIGSLGSDVTQSDYAYRPDTVVSLPRFDFGRVSSATRRLAVNVAALHAASGGDAAALLEGLVSTMGTPAPVLVNEMERALEEVRENLSRNSPDVVASDPWKGRFGSRAASNGFRLVLLGWEPSNDPDFLSLHVAVTREDGKDVEPRTVARFFLHPTFNPYTQDVPFRGQEATFTCYAYGAFTLGVLVSDGTRLELDLEEDTRLPVHFRDR